MNKLLLSLLVLISFVVLTGCPGRKIIESDYIKYDSVKDSLAILALDPVIQKNDILSIIVSVPGGEYEQNLGRLYNPSEGQVNQTNLAMTGYLVSPKGTLTIPAIGEVEAAGKTKQELIDNLYEKYKKFINKPVVISVRLLNFKVFIEGEVARPGFIDVPNELITLQQAIAIAGGTTLFAKLNDVVVFRYENGKRKVAHIDLRNDQLFTTYQEFFYLKQGDYISIKANKEKIISSNQSTTRTISYATTAVTILLTLFTLLRN
jgi:polysaccharide biosynthesis/export protein